MQGFSKLQGADVCDPSTVGKRHAEIGCKRRVKLGCKDTGLGAWVVGVQDSNSSISGAHDGDE
eukprot:scaffold99755_cov62-Attheya_sp.AAC.5